MEATVALKTGSWTKEETEKVIALYLEQDVKDPQEIADELKRSKRSVVGKLVSESVYVTPEKPKAKKKDEGPTKKEILREIAATGFEVDGFDNVTKPALTRLQERLAS